MMIFKKIIPRRTFLRGMGTTLALPLLDGMVPAMATPRDTSAKPATRMSFVYVPSGIIMEKWTPAKEGAEFELAPILSPLAAFRDNMLVLTGLAQNSASRQPGDAGGDHPRAGAVYLTGVHPKKRQGDRGISIDQLVAKELGKKTQLASLELALDTTELVGVSEDGYSFAYTNTLSWSSATTPVLMENHPRAVFERLFGDSDTTDQTQQLVRIRENRSILDYVTEATSRLMTGLGPKDRAKLSDYLDSIRDVERRIHLAEEQGARELPVMERPAGIPATFDEHAKLMFDLQVLAYQSDLTRVVTFMMSREKSVRPYPEIGIPDAHHPLTHHAGDPEKIAKTARINTFHTQTFAYLLEKLKATQDGDGSLLDHTMIVYGSGLGNGNNHSYYNLPIAMFGGGAKLKMGRHIRYPENTPMTNLFLTMLDKLELPLENFGDSTGRLQLLST